MILNCVKRCRPNSPDLTSGRRPGYRQVHVQGASYRPRTASIEKNDTCTPEVDSTRIECPDVDAQRIFMDTSVAVAYTGYAPDAVAGFDAGVGGIVDE